MKQDNASKTKAIAKNTLILYVRMIFLLLIGLYTSRVVLEALGENDLGIYNVVGGVVSIFTIISGALNSAISRFITFEMGKGTEANLNRVYSTAVTIQMIIALIVIAVAEPAGLWFIKNEMTIAPERIPAAIKVLHFSILSFAVNLMSVPQMASITAHEKMSAYAYIGILDGILRLATALLIARSAGDRLVQYAMLMALTVLLVRMVYGAYCRRYFSECRYRPVFDSNLMKEMFSFAGWNFIGVTSGVLRDQGGNILVNLFSGTAVNAARGMAVQLNGAVQGFVTNFMTAVNPQITKSYANGDLTYMFSLMLRSSRMAFYLLFVIALPLLFNTEPLLALWLKDVPEHTSLFVKLFLVFSLSESLSNPLVTGMLATGRIRNYQIVVGGLQLLNLPISYLCLKLGAVPEVTVVVAIILSQVCLGARLVMLRSQMGFPAGEYLRKVYLNILLTVLCAAVPSYFMNVLKPEGWMGVCISVVLCVVFAGSSIFWVGFGRGERKTMLSKIKGKVRR